MHSFGGIFFQIKKTDNQGGKSGKQNHQRQSLPTDKRSEQNHEFDVARAESVNASQKFVALLQQKKKSGSDSCSDKSVFVADRENKAGGNGKHSAAQRKNIGENIAFKVDKRGDEQNSDKKHINQPFKTKTEFPRKGKSQQA